MVKYLSLLPVLTLFFTCTTTEIQLDLPFDGERIVANGFLTPEGLRLNLTLSADPNDTFYVGNVNYLENADVLLESDEGLSVLVPEVAPGRYLLTQPLPATAIYRLSLRADGLPPASVAQLRIPEPVGELAAELLEPLDSSRFGFSGDYRIRAEHEVAFPGREEEYFLEIKTETTPTDEGFTVYNYSGLELEFEAACGVIGFTYTTLRTACFRDVANRIRITSNGYVTLPPEELVLTVSVIDSGFYDHARRLQQPYDGFQLIYNDPNLYVNNVEGGFGYVSPRRETAFRWRY